MILNHDSRPLAITLDAATLTRLDTASAAHGETLDEYIHGRLSAGVRDIELGAEDHQRIADDMRAAIAESVTIPATGFLIGLHRDMLAKLSKLAVANGRTIDAQAGSLLTA